MKAHAPKERFRLYHIGDARPRCIAYIPSADGGRICGEPASVVDEQRGGMVCPKHDPNRKARL